MARTWRGCSGSGSPRLRGAPVHGALFDAGRTGRRRTTPSAGGRPRAGHRIELDTGRGPARRRNSPGHAPDPKAIQKLLKRFRLK